MERKHEAPRRRPEKERKGLKMYSRIILDVLARHKSATHSVVTETVCSLVHRDPSSSRDGSPREEKNVKRRVYDAINVMCAVGLIKKDRRTITLNSHTGCGGNEEGGILRRRILDKKNILEEAKIRRDLLVRLIERNREMGEELDKERLQLPFLIVYTEKRSNVECETNEKRSFFRLTFSKGYRLYEDAHVLRLLFPDVQGGRKEGFLVSGATNTMISSTSTTNSMNSMNGTNSMNGSTTSASTSMKIPHCDEKPWDIASVPEEFCPEIEKENAFHSANIPSSTKYSCLLGLKREEDFSFIESDEFNNLYNFLS